MLNASNRYHTREVHGHMPHDPSTFLIECQDPIDAFVPEFHRNPKPTLWLSAALITRVASIGYAKLSTTASSATTAACRSCGMPTVTYNGGGLQS
jgi:hypothetical protein